MVDILQNLLNEYEVKHITEENFHEIWEIHKSNPDYFMLTGSEEASFKDSFDDLKAAPPNFDISKKLSVGFFENNQAIAFLDALDGYPNSECFYIGLFLVNQKLQKKGIGVKIINALTKAVKLNGNTLLQLGVVEENKGAITFWEKSGFIKIKESTFRNKDNKDLNVFVMEKQVNS